MAVITAQIQIFQQQVFPAALVVVTKHQPKSALLKVLESNPRHIGENKLQEIERRFDTEIMNKLKNKNIKLHFIGHLQTNKVKEVLNYVDVIQSVDTLKLAKKISQESENRGKVTEIYLQINSTDEPQKHGFIPSQITTLWPELTVLPGITITGLMCMGKQSDLIATRSAFKKCKKLCRKLNLLKCSMGMSSDYAIALEEGSTMVRIGSAIFNQDELEREG